MEAKMSEKAASTISTIMQMKSKIFNLSDQDIENRIKIMGLEAAIRKESKLIKAFGDIGSTSKALLAEEKRRSDLWSTIFIWMTSQIRSGRRWVIDAFSRIWAESCFVIFIVMANNEECFRKCDLIDKYLLDKLRTESTEFYGYSPNRMRFTTKTVYESVMRPSLQSKKRTNQKTQPVQPLNVYSIESEI